MASNIVSDMMIQAERELLPTLAMRGSQVEEAVSVRVHPANQRNLRMRHVAGAFLVKIGSRLAAVPGANAAFESDNMPAAPLRP